MTRIPKRGCVLWLGGSVTQGLACFCPTALSMLLLFTHEVTSDSFRCTVPTWLLCPWLLRQEYWSGLLFPSPGEPSDLGSKPCPLHWQADSLPPRPGKSSLSIFAFNPGLVSFMLRSWEHRTDLFLNWGITALECRVSFCCTRWWIGRKCTCTPSLSGLSLTSSPTPSPPLGHHRAPSWVELPVVFSVFPLAVSRMVMRTCPSQPPSQTA